MNSLKVIDTRNPQAVRANPYPLSPAGNYCRYGYDAVQRVFTGCRTSKGLSVVSGGAGKVVTTPPSGPASMAKLMPLTAAKW